MSQTLLDFEVTDKKSFIEFINLLDEDFRHFPSTWENNNLSKFLGAIGEYTKDIQGYYDNTNQNVNSDEPSWKVFADILKGATMYE